jgi:hypothetical protein
MLFEEIIFILSENHMKPVKMHLYCVLNQMVHMVTTGL